MVSLTVTMPRLHAGQMEVFQDDSRFKVLVTGRRWGKTRLGTVMCIDYALRGMRAWWVAPSHPMATVGWRGLKELAQAIPGVSKREKDRLLTFHTGGSVQVRSADNPDSLRGEGLDFLVIDEGAFMKEEAWTQALRPALSDRQGRALIISTPRGRNWFFKEFQRGIDPAIDEQRSWNLPSSSNPFMPDGEIEAAREQLPEDVFAQEYLAEFIDNAGIVFRNIRACVIGGMVATPIENHRYVMGVDWAQLHDFTVLTVMDAETMQVVEIVRFNKMEWEFQRKQIANLAHKWGVQYILAEENSIGGPNIEALRRDGLPIIPFVTTNASKAEAVQALVLAFENQSIAIIDDPVLIGELMAFERIRLPSGKWKYGAPSGMHDDAVISLMLAYRAAQEQYSSDIEVIKSEPFNFSNSDY